MAETKQADASTKKKQSEKKQKENDDQKEISLNDLNRSARQIHVNLNSKE